MKNRNLYIAWAALYVLCAALGFIPAPESTLYVLAVAASLVFFVPPAVLLYRYAKGGQVSGLRLMRNLSLWSLGLTVTALILNFMAVGASAAAGKVLYWLLILVSAPMVSMQIWVLSLFLWAVLLVIAVQELRKNKKNK